MVLSQWPLNLVSSSSIIGYHENGAKVSEEIGCVETFLWLVVAQLF